jgi:CTP:molybdopterin cytidylyltransferase MocA
VSARPFVGGATAGRINGPAAGRVGSLVAPGSGRVIGLILAAGAGTRFGGGKMAALLDGRSLPAHVALAARAGGVADLVVVLGRDAATVAAAMAPDLASGPFLRVVNPAPERGLASSLRIGMAAATALDPAAVLVLLGDQPLVRPDVIRALLAAAPAAAAPGAAASAAAPGAAAAPVAPAPAPDPDLVAIAPRYADDAALNPVLVLPAGFALATRAEGDRGLGPFLAAAGDRVLRLGVAGANPDIDTPADLAVLGAAGDPAAHATQARGSTC